MMPRLLAPAALGVLVVLAGCITGSQPPQPLAAPGAGLFHELCQLSNWNDTCTIKASGNPSPSKAEIDLAVNPKDPLNVIVGSKDLDRKASDCVWAVPQVTKDGGKTWTTVYIGGDKATRQADLTNPLAPWDCITDPILTFDQDGIAYYSLQAYNVAANGNLCQQDQVLGLLPPLGLPITGCGSAFYLAVSHDGGLTWPTGGIKLMAIGDGNVVFHDYPRTLWNPRTHTVSTVWNALTPAGGNAWVVSTRDQGQSVTLPTIVSSSDAPAATFFDSGFAAGKDGTVYMTVGLGGSPADAVLASPSTGTTSPVYLAVSTDDADSFGGFAKMFDVTPIKCPLPNSKFRCGTAVELAADAGDGAHGGRLYAVWEDGRLHHSDILSSFSDDQGKTWSPPVMVNQDKTTHDKWMSRVKVGLDGTVHVLFMDRSYDPGNKLYGATHAWSVDGGRTWQQEQLTRALSDGDLGIHQGGFPFIGDYVGIDVKGKQGEHVYMGFPETVTGRAEVAVAHVMRTDALEMHS